MVYYEKGFFFIFFIKFVVLRFFGFSKVSADERTSSVILTQAEYRQAEEWGKSIRIYF
ncbi:hypothetical protein ACVRY2_09605 [Streptococcus iniae]